MFIHTLWNKLLQMHFISFILHNFKYNKNHWWWGKYLVGVYILIFVLLMVTWIFTLPSFGNFNEIALTQFVYTCTCKLILKQLVYKCTLSVYTFVYIQFADMCESTHSFKFLACIIHTQLVSTWHIHTDWLHLINTHAVFTCSTLFSSLYLCLFQPQRDCP